MSATEPQEDESRRRWRLILGRDATGSDGTPVCDSLPDNDQAIDQALSFLFDREFADDANLLREKHGGSEASRISVPHWLSQIRELFPESTAESMTRVAVQRYHLMEVLADEETIEKVQPSLELLRTLLAVKQVVPAKLLGAVRRIIRKVVDELRLKLETSVRHHFAGAIHRRSRSVIPLAKNFDVLQTIRRNLKHYQPDEKRLLIDHAYFFSRIHRRQPWDLILVVDQSASMTDAIIHAVVMTGIFRSLPSLRTTLVLFDTSVVDASEISDDPVELLMRVQLGGGTDIGQALRYADSCVTNPRRTILVLVTDFYEGASEQALKEIVAKLSSHGVTMLGLAALDDRSKPAYHHSLARELARRGMHIGAMTPDRLAEWVAERVHQ